MDSVDLQLLPALEDLLLTASVSEAAQRQGLSAPAMSRILAKLRVQTGDQLLVRAGRGMVRTPRGEELLVSLPAALRAVRLAVTPRGQEQITRREPFRIRSSDVVPALLGIRLLRELAQRVSAPEVVFVPEGAESDEALRAGDIDIDIGVQNLVAPELRVRHLFVERMVGVAAVGHPVHTAPDKFKAFAESRHVAISRRGTARGPVDALLRERGVSRSIPIVVSSYSDAAMLARGGDYIAIVPELLAAELGDAIGLSCFELPFDLPLLKVALAWHPRMQDEPGHKLLRQSLIEIAATFR